PQELMWLLSNVLPNSYVYSVPRSLRLVGDLDVEALRRALDTIVERHEILRTTYALIDGVPTQIIGEHRPFELPVTDLTGQPEEARERLVEASIEQDLKRGFDLTRDLLLRASLLKLGEREHVLVMTTHHIASDGVSKQVFFREFTTLYGAYRAGRGNPLPELAIQYADYAYWERARLTGTAIAALLAHWKEKLAGAPALLDLPSDRPRPPVQTFRGGAYRRMRTLPLPLLRELKALSREEKTTLFMTGLAA